MYVIRLTLFHIGFIIWLNIVSPQKKALFDEWSKDNDQNTALGTAIYIYANSTLGTGCFIESCEPVWNELSKKKTDTPLPQLCLEPPFLLSLGSFFFWGAVKEVDSHESSIWYLSHSCPAPNTGKLLLMAAILQHFTPKHSEKISINWSSQTATLAVWFVTPPTCPPVLAVGSSVPFSKLSPSTVVSCRGPGLCLEFLEIKSHWRNRMNECLEKGNQMVKIHHQFMIISLLDIFGCIATLAFPESSEATALSRFSRVFALPWLKLAELLPWDAGIGECQWRWDLSHSCCQPRTKMSPHCWFM